MHLSTRTWYSISVLCLLGAIYFWWLGNQHPPQPKPAPGPAAVSTNPPAPTNHSPGGTGNLLPSTTPTRPPPLLSVLAASNAPTVQASAPLTPRPGKYPYRRRNTTESIPELIHRETSLLLQNALLDTAHPVALNLPASLRATEDPGSYVIQSRGPMTDAFRMYLQAAGAQIIAYIPNNAYLVRVSADGASKMASLGLTQAVLPWEPYYKLEAPLLTLAVEQKPLPADTWLNVLLFPTEQMPDLGLEVISQDRTPFGPLFVVRAQPDSLVTLAQRPEVQDIARYRHRVPANDLTRKRLNISSNTTATVNYLGLTGNGVLVNVNDTGADTNHPDLYPRIYTDPVTSPFLTNEPAHGTHVLGTLLSSGAHGPTANGTNVFGSTNGANFRGMASSASAYLLPIQLQIGTNHVKVPDWYLQERAALSNAFISLNSWNYEYNPLYDNDIFYDISAASYDMAVRDALPSETGSQPLCYVFPAGNEGFGTTDGRGGSPGSILSPGTAKNVITVGAVENLREMTFSGSDTNDDLAYYEEITDSDNEVADFSSRGNVGFYEGERLYGRFKPDVVAPGVMVVSTRPQNWTNPDTNIAALDAQLGTAASSPYGYESGTSMAAASVSGLLALMQEYFEQRMGLTNSPALMKALLINGARSLSSSYDYRAESFLNYQGWGLPNLTNSLPLGTNAATSGSLFMIDQITTNALATDQVHTRRVTLNNTNARNAPLRITLVWTDPPGHPNASLVKLVNDLDLVVTEAGTNSSGVTSSNSFLGNHFPLGSTFSAPVDLNGTNATVNLDLARDRLNNVEQIVLEPPLASAYDIAVVGRRVNVNAVTAHTNGIVQDYALVVSSDDRTNANSLTLTDVSFASTNGPHVVALTTLTNGTPFFNQKQRVGANSPLLVSTNGATNQWNFYQFTTPTNASNALFVLFYTPFALNLSRPRYSEADIDLYVTTDSNLLTLDDTLFASSNLLRSVQRKAYEFVAITNAQPNQTFYVGVKSEDQMAAEYGIFAGSFSEPPYDQRTNGPVVIQGFPADIPDGTPSVPVGAVPIIAFCPYHITVRNVVVTNTLFHEFGGDLFGQLEHESQVAVLNNHRAFSGEVTYIYDDSGSGKIPDSQPSDGPPNLRNFAGTDGYGPWTLTMVDNALFHTGRVEQLSIELEPEPPRQQNDFGYSYTYTGTVLGGFWDRFTADVPFEATNLTVCVYPQNGPLDVYIRYGQDPDQTNYDHHVLIQPPGDCITITKFDSPPLRDGRYYIGVYNPNSIDVQYTIVVSVGWDLRPGFPLSYRASGITQLPDDAVTNSVIHVPDNQYVASVDVGVRIVHPRASDLSLHLISPQGTRLLLTENRGGYNPDGYGASTQTTNFFQATANGGPNPDTNTIGTTFNEGVITIDYKFYNVPDRMTVYYDGNLIFDTGTISGSGTIDIPYGPGVSTDVVIVMNETGGPPGTAWDYTATIVSGQYIYTTFTENTNLTTTPIKFGIPPYTNNLGLTNLGIPVPVSDFDTVAATNYLMGDTFEGWQVDSGEVEVINDPTLAHTGSNFLALANGRIVRTLSTIPGTDYRLTYAVRDPGIVGWWPGETNANDIVNGNDGVLVGPVTYDVGYITNTFQYAFQFNGSDNVEIPDAPDLNPTNGVTLECWVKMDPNPPRTFMDIFGKDGEIANRQYDLGLSARRKFRAHIGAPPGAPADYLYLDGTTAAQADQWYHIAMTYDLNRLVLYVDGVLEVSVLTNRPMAITTEPLRIGGGPPVSGRSYYFPGLVDEPSLYSRALSPTEISAIYDAGLVRVGKCSIPSCKPNGLVTVQGLSRTVIGGPTWQTNSVVFTANSTNTYMEIDGNPLSLLLDSFALTPVRAPAYYLPEEPLTPLRGQLAAGDWTLEIWDNRVGAVATNVLLSWKLDIRYINTNPPAITLPHGECLTNTVAGGGTVYYIVNVPPAASFATNRLLSLSGGDLDLYFNQNALPVGNISGDTNTGPNVPVGGGDVLLLDNITGGEAVISTTGLFTTNYSTGVTNQDTAPVLLRSRTYYLAVQNPDPTNATDFQICLQFDRIGSALPALVGLTNGLGYTNCLPAGAMDYYVFNASSNAEAVTFELTNLTGNADLYVQHGPPLPTNC